MHSYSLKLHEKPSFSVFSDSKGSFETVLRLTGAFAEYLLVNTVNGLNFEHFSFCSQIKRPLSVLELTTACQNSKQGRP